jgi:hypothetical protein
MQLRRETNAIVELGKTPMRSRTSRKEINVMQPRRNHDAVLQLRGETNAVANLWQEINVVVADVLHELVIV